MSFDPQSPSDRADLEPDELVIDWNAKLHVTTPMPKDREFWIVTDEGEAHEVAYYDEASFWMNRDIWARQDGESGSWGADEILGWTDDARDAEEAAALLLKAAA